MICDKCQRELPEPKVIGPTKCKCGNWIDAGYPVACHHRGPRIGNASCGCGSVYECTLHGVLCGNKQPPDEWADVNGRLLGAGFRVCGMCGDFAAK